MKNDEFDIDRVGKRMPYTVPDDFFEKIEKSVWEEIKEGTKQPEKRRKPVIPLFAKIMTGVAAAIILFLIVNANIMQNQVDEFGEIEQAFAGLNSDDQAYLLDVYGEDVFINN